MEILVSNLINTSKIMWFPHNNIVPTHFAHDNSSRIIHYISMLINSVSSLINIHVLKFLARLTSRHVR